MQDLIERFVATTNAADVDGTLRLFARDATLTDTSVGETYNGRAGIRRYEDYFVGYNTTSRILSVEQTGANRATARVDFTGNFGHEVGFLDVAANAEGEIVALETYLE